MESFFNPQIFAKHWDLKEREIDDSFSKQKKGRDLVHGWLGKWSEEVGILFGVKFGSKIVRIQKKYIFILFPPNTNTHHPPKNFLG